MRTLLCVWFGKYIYEDDASREEMIAIIKHLQKDLERYKVFCGEGLELNSRP